MLSKKLKSNIIKEAHEGKLNLLHSLKDQDVNIHWTQIKDPYTGDSILHTATRLGLINIIEELIENYQPFNPNLPNNDCKTALHEAAQASHPNIVQLLIEKGADVNALKRADWTPLMLACTKNCLKTIQILLEYKALINWKNKDGWTAFHLACRVGHEEIVKLLLSSGADFKLKTNNQRNALHIAALHGHPIIVQQLLQTGLNVDEEDSCGNTALHEAVLGGNLEVYRILKGKTRSLQLCNRGGFNLLHLASSEGHEDIIYDLVKNEGFYIDQVMIGNGTPQATPIECALRNKKYNCVEYLKNLRTN